ncbi:MAG: HAD-IIA family hydrolase [Anaerolineaceae bacterium]|nr:HAD-IIA family hydrolase [Anaerolineaceae bacterium]
MPLNKMKSIKALILDMDGVLWRADQAIGDLPAIFQRIDKLGLNYMMATNNTTRGPELIVTKLRSFGADCPVDRIVNSGMATLALLLEKWPEGGPVFIVGEEGVHQALEKGGFFHSVENPLAVIAGFDREINYNKIQVASNFIQKGAFYIGTNPDTTFPTPTGMIPGAGAMIAAITAAAGVEPVFAGKPSPTLFKLAMDKMNVDGEHTLVVGDRLETDILGGINAGCKTALVLSGIHTIQDMENSPYKPDLVAENLGRLLE